MLIYLNIILLSYYFFNIKYWFSYIYVISILFMYKTFNYVYFKLITVSYHTKERIDIYVLINEIKQIK